MENHRVGLDGPEPLIHKRFCHEFLSRSEGRISVSNITKVGGALVEKNEALAVTLPGLDSKLYASPELTELGELAQLTSYSVSVRV